MKQKQILIILAIGLVLAVAVFVLLRPRFQSTIELKASADKSSYKAGEQINLAINLKNTGKSATCVSDMSLGNIKFVSLTRNNANVESRSTPSYFITSFPLMLKNSLVTLGPGESFDIGLRSGFDDGLAKQALRTAELVNGRGISTFYNVATPGNYSLELAYQYTGPKSSDCPGVSRSETNKAVITFTITP
jgi:hypothetical protein